MTSSTISYKFASLFLLLACCIQTQTSHAEIYKWTDESGKVHFGDRPPNRETAKDLSDDMKHINVASEFTTPEQMLKLKQESDSKRKASHETQKRLEKEKAELDRWCRQMEKRLREIRGPVNFYDDDGKPIKVTEKERVAKVKQEEKMYNESCK